MKSKASIKSHPLHPMLIAFPVAFFTGALVFDVLYLVLKAPTLWYTGMYLAVAGIFGGMAAAVPGIIDFMYTVPPESSAKKRAAKHGLLNTANLLLFVFIVFYRKDQPAGTLAVILLEVVGVVLLSIAGWMGGTLVYRNQIGVDPRYAYAGKWKEEVIDDESHEIKVAAVNELKVNQMKLIHLRGRRIVIARTETGHAAFDDRCTHKGGSLAGGSLICGTVQCPWHGSQFSVTTGEVKAGPAVEKIETYTVEERDGNVFLKLS